MCAWDKDKILRAQVDSEAPQLHMEVNERVQV